MPKSRLVKINDYALLEITYEHTTINTESSGFTIINNTIQQYTEVLNDNRSAKATGNVLDRSSVQLGANQWVRTEQDVPIPYLNTDQRFEVTSLSQEIPTQQWNVTYDRIRVHILSGYTFTSSSGFVLDVSYPEANKVKNSHVGMQTYVNGDDYIVFNTRPMVINGVNYDKYVEFLVPSLSDMITEYNAASDKQDAIAYYLTSDNGGFLTEGLIKFNFYEIEQVNSINGYDYLTTGVPSYVSIEPQDQFSNLAAVIKQNGDYFEYYPTWDDAFISDYIAILNETRGKYVVIHELTVSEQVGFSQLYSSSNVILQTDDFDQPSLFKPILKNADTAFSFSIDYTMRLTNETDGSQIIRTASVTSFEPKKFGKNNLKLNVREDVVPYKVYNKVTDGPVFNLPVPKQDIRVQRIISPSFFENNNISVSTGKMFIDKTGQFIPEDLFEWDIIFGQTEAIILVNPFDNYFKFNVFRVTPDSIESLDLSNAQEINLIFETTSGNKYRYSMYQPFPANETAITNQINDTKSGKIIFRVPANDASRMIEDLPGKFYITVRNKNIVRARVSLEIASDLRGKEVTIPFSDWAQKTKEDLITVYNNLKPYTIEKRYLEVIEVVPDGLTGEETAVYNGNVDRIENYQTALDLIDQLRNTAFLTRLNAIKDRESSLETKNTELNAREAQLNSKEATLKALETALIGEQQTLAQQTASIQDQKTELDRRNALLKQREEELKKLAEDAKSGQSAAVKELSDVIKSLREEIERLSNLNKGNQGTQGGTNGTQGGKKNNNLNVDFVVNEANVWQNWLNSGDMNLGGQSGKGSPTPTTVYYDVYYFNSDTFVARYEIRSITNSSFTAQKKQEVFDKEFVNDPRTGGGKKYTELKKKQSRKFQPGETTYDSKWFVDKQENGSNGGTNRGNNDQNTEGNSNNNTGNKNSGSTTKVKFAVIEFGTDGFTKVGQNPKVYSPVYEGLVSKSTEYSRRVGWLTGFRVEVALDEFYLQGKDEASKQKNTFLAGYSKYIDKLTKSTIEKEVSSVTNTITNTERSLTYLYGNKTKYINTLVNDLNNTNTEVGFKIDRVDTVTFNNGTQLLRGWEAVFEVLSRNQGVGEFNLKPYTDDPNRPSQDGWEIPLARFYDDILLSFFDAKTNSDKIKDTSLVTNLIVLQNSTTTNPKNTIEYVQVVRTPRSAIRGTGTGTSPGTFNPEDANVAYMTLYDAENFLDVNPNIVVYMDQKYTTELPASLSKTVGGANYYYNKNRQYEISDWLSGFPPQTILKYWEPDIL
jgi:hypothetical protein